MNADQFYQLLQQPSNLSKVSIEELKALNRNYPWFGAGYFLTAVKLKQAHFTNADDAAQKALLYFPDTLWMNWQWKRFEDANGMTPVSETEEEEILEQEHTLSNGTVFVTKTEEFIQQNEADAAADAEVLTEAYEHLDSSVNAALVLPIPAPVKDTATELSFEPLHTTDYFASQGIKLKEEKLGDDNLSKQVKTFTQWLKTMKKVYAEENTAMDVKLEQNVVQIADESNQQAEVITETMANVLVQQGKLSKAIELYGKLSLLHPEKSAYFALRISELKS